MSSTRNVIAPGVFANDALTVIPPSPVAGTAYRDPATSVDDSERGWPFATAVDSATFNQIMFQMSSLLAILDGRGLLGWTSARDYTTDAVQMGSDGLMYQALQPSGPGGVGAKDPVSEPTYWIVFGGRQATAAEAVALTVRNRTISPASLKEAFQGSNQTLAVNGYQRLPGGLIVQWGTTAVGADTTAPITFPIPFPIQLLGITGSGDTNFVSGASNQTAPAFTNRLATGCTLANDTGAQNVSWFAWGR